MLFKRTPTGQYATLAEAKDAIYPIGSVYCSVSPISPATLFGGTWEAFAAGRMLLGVDPNNLAFNDKEKTGGTDVITPEGTVSQPTFTGDALASHQHAAASAGTPAGSISGIAISDHSDHTHTIAQSAFTTTRPGTAVGNCYNGGGIVTSPSGNPNAKLTHSVSNNGTFSGNALADHQHDGISAGTPSGSVSQPSFTGQEVSVLNPFITVYMWKRTA